MSVVRRLSDKHLGAIAKALWKLEKTVQELHELVDAAYQGDCEAAEKLNRLLATVAADSDRTDETQLG